jgi:hypothetical protein
LADIHSSDLLDRDACVIASREVRYRRLQAHLVATLIKRRLWCPLGFSRLGDYAVERLGVSARSLEEDARVVTALAVLPLIRSAFESRAIRWTQARLLTSIATPRTEEEWLRVALPSTTRRLTDLIKDARRRRAAAGQDPDVWPAAENSKASGADPDACASRAVPAAGRDPDACASRAAAACATAEDPEHADPTVLWTIVVTRTGRKLWRMVGDLASRMCGVDVPASRVAEAVAAEALSWPVWEPPLAAPLPPRAARERTSSYIAAFEARYGTSEGFTWLEAPPAFHEREPDLDHLGVDLDRADAHEIDRRLAAVRSAMQQIDAELGAVLRTLADRNVHQRLGFADLRLYAEGRLGICGSKAMALVRLDRRCALQSPALLRAYREGRVTWLAATALLPVISPEHEDAWVERAERVTLRRLDADVSWALDRADDVRGKPRQAPPPLDLDVTADAFARSDEADIQMRAHAGTDLESFVRRVDAEIRIPVPASIAVLLEDAIEGCRRAVEPRWRGFERILAHAWLVWMALPKHENPVFSRDSNRCQVPGCRNRAPLHAHHILFRSLGGPDFDWNLTAVCEEHHRAIHRGDIHVTGRAPDGLLWELGCRAGRRPLLRLRGDVYLKE